MVDAIHEEKSLFEADPAFAGLVVELWKAKQRQKLAGEERAKLWSAMERWANPTLARGPLMLVEGVEVKGRLVAVKRTATVTRVDRAVSSAAAKNHSLATWELGVGKVPWMQATPDRRAVGAPDLSFLGLPVMGELKGSMKPSELHRRLQRWSDLKLAEAEREARDALTAYSAENLGFGAEGGWDGSLIQFGDGWKVSLTTTRYSSDRLKAANRRLWDRLAVDKTVEVAGHLYFATVDEEEMADLELAD